jgi:hypothetical protein
VVLVDSFPVAAALTAFSSTFEFMLVYQVVLPEHKRMENPEAIKQIL